MQTTELVTSIPGIKQCPTPPIPKRRRVATQERAIQREHIIHQVIQIVKAYTAKPSELSKPPKSPKPSLVHAS